MASSQSEKNRQAALEKKRSQMMQDFALQKSKISGSNANLASSIAASLSSGSHELNGIGINGGGLITKPGGGGGNGANTGGGGNGSNNGASGSAGGSGSGGGGGGGGEKSGGAAGGNNRFVGQNDSMEESLKKSTVGLVHLKDFKERREELEEQKRREAAKSNELDKEAIRQNKKRKKEEKKKRAKLSFAADFDEDEEQQEENGQAGGDIGAKPSELASNGKGKATENSKKRKQEGGTTDDDLAEREETNGEIGNGVDIEGALQNNDNDNSEPPPNKKHKSSENDTSSSSTSLAKSSSSTGGGGMRKNPHINTSFLPDRARETLLRQTRESLRLEYLQKQEALKNEMIEIVYSYWDGSGHRKSVQVKKGESVGGFLEKCRSQTNELRGVGVDNLMYVKEDLIIPHHYTFYDFIINKYRGKSGPLFNFDVHDDVRMLADATVEKDESHAGKVVERSWYNRSKHIFPASRWEVFEPGKDYGKYTIA